MKKLASIKKSVVMDKKSYSIIINGQINSIHFNEETLAIAITGLEAMGYKVVRE